MMKRRTSFGLELSAKRRYDTTGASHEQMKRISHVRQRCSEPSAITMSA